MEEVLSQLAHGSVKTSFGELRAALPGLFEGSDENDARQIALPLNEIISRINPALLPRRAAKKIEVRDNIVGPFGMHTSSIAFTPPQAPARPVPMPPGKTPEPATAPTALSVAELPPTFVRKTAATAPKPTPDAATPAPIPFSPARAASVAGPGDLQLPLSSVIALLPMDLCEKLVMTPPAGAYVPIPVEKVLSQFAHGSVKISFGELRAALPGLFDNSNDNDERQIVLPLNEIISRINPALLSRRVTKKIEVADNIVGPFGMRTQDAGAAPPQAPVKPGPTTPPPKAPALVPAPATTPAAPAAPAPRIPPPPTVVSKTTVAAPKPAPIPFSPARTGSAAPVPPAPVKPVFSAPPPAPAIPATGGFNTAPKIPIAAPTVPVGNSFLAPLSALAEKWPETIKMELIQADLMNAQVVLPTALIEPGLKSGRVMVRWKNLRAMIHSKPAPVSVHDGVEVELPLKVLAPLFFASQKAAGLAKQKVSVSAEIPDLFHGSKKAEAAVSPAPAPAPTTKPAPTPAPTPAPAPASVRPPAPAPAPIPAPKPAPAPVRSPVQAPISAPAPTPTPAPVPVSAQVPPPAPVPIPAPPAPVRPLAPAPAPAPAIPAELTETNFFSKSETPSDAEIEQQASSEADFKPRSATPREIVTRAMALPGVAGAVVALYDGLLIAGQVPPDSDADTLAAFVPQIFARTGQSTKGLHMGELNNLSFTVGNVSWKIFRVSAVYLAVFGRAGQALPTAPLAALAGQLDRKNK
jgi:predicted regulator of Ras-like GTPase activity (Roadblock/LC7/MglB family)